MAVALTISTKLFRPQPARELVERPRLLDLLNQRLALRRLTIVSAPPGYGKTTLVAHWLSTLDVPAIWLTLDKLDNDLWTFAEYLTIAVRSVYPDFCVLATGLLVGPESATPATMADALIEDLANLPGPLVITLDDFQVIGTSSVHECLQRIVQYLPTNCHLAIITRQTPPWPLGRLRMSSDLREIGQEDLRFTAAETTRFLNANIQKPLSNATIESIERYAEGWAVGLQLATLGYLALGEDSELDVASYFNQAHVTEYLMDEVLAKQTAATRDFLLRTSILNRFCDPLVRAVLDMAPVEGTLPTDYDMPTINWLMRANLFLTPLDRQGVWFRYHHLFQDFLQRRLPDAVSPAELRAMHRRASDWFEQQGLIEEAITHAVAADDEENAVRIAVSYAYKALNREEWQRMIHWLALLPEPARHHPAALVIRGWVLAFQSRIHTLALVVEEVEARLAAAGEQTTHAQREFLRPQIDVQKAALAYWRGDLKTTLALTQQALLKLGPDMLYAHSEAHLLHAISLHAIHGADEAQAYLQAALEGQYESSDTITARLLLAQVSIHADSGNTRQMVRSAELLLKVGERSGLTTSINWANYGLGIVAYELNDLPLAETYMRLVIGAAHYGNDRTIVEAFIAYALILEAMGRPAAADDTLRQLREFLVEADYNVAFALADATHLYLAAGRGEHASARPPVEPPSEAAAKADLSFSFLISPLLAQARYLIAAGRPEDLEGARVILDASRRAAESLHHSRQLTFILALEATLAIARGDEPAALDALDRGLRLARPSQRIRSFVDCGPALIPLLERLREGSPAAGYIERILGAFASTPASAGIAPAAASMGPNLHLRASLTNREMDVLLLLAARLSNKEIAARMVVAPETVKHYTSRIFQKLGVNNRRAAVSLALHLGLIPS